MKPDFIMSWSRKSKDKLNDTSQDVTYYEKQIWT